VIGEKLMCKYCDNHEDYYEGSLLTAKIELGFGGDEYIWVLIDPDTKKLGIVVLNPRTSEQRESFIKVNYCPICGRRIKK